MEAPLLIDTLDAALGSLQPRGAFFYRSELRAPWGLAVPTGPASFHLIESGRCVLDAEGEAPVWLEAGDFVVLPHGTAHTLRDAPGRPTQPAELLYEAAGAQDEGVVHVGEGGMLTELVCGGVAFDDAVTHPVLDALPRVLVVRGAARDEVPWLRQTLRFLTCEARSRRPGAGTVMGHLISVLFVQAIRAALTEEAAGPPGWLGALRDPHVGPALLALQAAPEAPWSVEDLAAEAGLGRSAFAARFREAVGEPPMRHVTRWRFYHAARLLTDDALTVAAVAARVGYESEPAFSRAFKRWTGHSPGHLRRTRRREAALHVNA